MSESEGRAVDRLGRPELAPVVDELVRRYGEGVSPMALTLRGLSGAQRAAVADLLGEDRLRGATCRLPVARLTTVLGVADGDALRALVEELRGPLVDRRAVRAAASAARASLWAWFGDAAAALLLDGGNPELLQRWVDGVRAAGVRGGIVTHRRRLEAALAVLRALPADGISLAGLADDVLGDPHALDRGRTVTALVLDAVATVLGRERATDAEAARLLWEAVGVVPDLLSSTVLALGLHPEGNGPVPQWLCNMADASEPVVLTLAQLRRWPVSPLPPSACAYVVENPSVVVDAASRGWDGPVLVCSSGRPTVAVVTLLRQLGASGATLAQHADFDAAGLAITSWLAERAGTTPWRMGVRDYEDAVAGERERRLLSERLPATPWDPRLQHVMASAGVVVYEEELRSDLLAAMRGAST